MEKTDCFLEYLKTEEGKKALEEAAKKVFIEKEEMDRKSKEVVSNENYMKWLEKFSLEHNKFYNDDWLYCPETLSENDNSNVNKLHLFFNGISLYADENNINPIKYDKNGFPNYNYKIQYNDKIYELGIMYGQGCTFSSEVLNINDNHDFICFLDIVKYNKGKIYKK